MRIATLGALGGALFIAPAALAQTAQPLPYSQAWTGATFAANSYASTPGVTGYRGDDLTMAIGTDPQTILADGSATPVNLNITPATPATASSGGLYYFAAPNPVVAFQGSGTADAPHLVVRVRTTGFANVRVQYNLRDVDDAIDDAAQPVALQFRAGTTGDYTNVAEAFVLDASTGPSLATLVTPVNVVLPAAANNVASLDIRWITANAPGSDELVGVDDISITGTPTTAAGETPDGALSLAVANPVRGAATVRFQTETTGTARLALYDVLGRRVAVLADGVAAGPQTATLSTDSLAPGVYLLRLDAGGRALTQTVTVVR